MPWRDSALRSPCSVPFKSNRANRAMLLQKKAPNRFVEVRRKKALSRYAPGGKPVQRVTSRLTGGTTDQIDVTR